MGKKIAESHRGITVYCLQQQQPWESAALSHSVLQHLVKSAKPSSRLVFNSQSSQTSVSALLYTLYVKNMHHRFKKMYNAELTKVRKQKFHYQTHCH